MKGKTASFRVGKVSAFRRSKIWYLCYYEGGRRRRPRIGPDRDLARQMAAQINGQLEVGAPAALSFEPISIPDLRQRWLDHHENVRRSSIETIRRYRAATEHLLNFVRDACPVRQASDFRPRHAEDFVRHLRGIQVAPNGHPRARKRTLRDAGIKFILETCSTLFNYAQRNRHLSPYAENPFRTIEINRVPIEDAKPIVVFTPDQEGKFFEACDDWQFPLFLTLLLTGLRPGELVHLLLPDDLDLETGWLRVRNKPELGWQVKTRNERDIPLVPVLKDVLRGWVDDHRAVLYFGNDNIPMVTSPHWPA
jgi:integrase